MGLEGLQFETVDVRFTQGLDTRTNKKLVVPGKWLDLWNVTLSKDNTPQLRDGHVALVSTSNGNGLFTRGTELLTISGPNVKSISTANSTAAAFSVPGVPGYVGISKSEVQRSSGMQDCPDVANVHGFTCYVWRAKSNLNGVVGFALTLVDESTGTAIQSNVAIHTSGGSDWIRVVATSDGAFFVVYRDGNNIFCRVIDTAAPGTLGTETSIVASGNIAGVGGGDACAFGGGVMIVYGWTDGVTSVQTLRITRVGTTPGVSLGPTNAIDQASLQIAGVTAITCCAYGNGNNAIVAATGNLGTKSGLCAAVINTSWAVSTAATRLSATTSTTTSSNHLCAIAESGTSVRIFRDFVSELGTNALNNILQQQVDNTLTTILASASLFPSATFGAGVVARGPNGPFIYGKPFTNGTNIFLPTFVFSIYNNLSSANSNPRNANTQNTYFVADCGRANQGFFDTSAVVGRALYGTLGVASINATPPTVSTCSSPQVGSTNGFASLVGELTFLVLSSGNNISPTGLVRLTLTPDTTLPLSRAELGESAYLAGGQISMYDGQSITEMGFPLFPEGIGLTPGGAGTGSMTDGVHQVVAVYSWIDNAGQRHLSAPSLPVTATVNSGGANTGSITVSVPTLLFSQKTGIEILFYVTVASGLSFFRALKTGGAYSPLLNSTAANQLNSYVISESDASLASNEVLYTQPNLSPTTLPNYAPSPCSNIWTAHRRLWFNKSDKPGWFGYSQEYINNVGLQFNDSLEDAMPVSCGAFVAGAELDEKIILFGANRPAVMYGTGPNPSGSFNNYSHPIAIETDVGCSDSLSVLHTPLGLIFKAQQGWHLLGRDLSVQYIGEGVAAFDAGSVTAAVMLRDKKEARFLLTGTFLTPTGNTVSGVWLIFSTLIGQWSYAWSRSLGVNYLPVDAVWWPTDASGAGRYVSISLTDGLNHDTPGVYIDTVGSEASAGIQWGARLAFVHLAKIEGYQRVRWMYLTATAASSPTASLSINVDFDDALNGVPGAYSFNVATSSLFPGGWFGQAIDVRSKLRRQKCKSVSILFQQSPGSSEVPITGIQAMAFQVGIKRGVNRLPAAQSVG
jgi:hypothetical protein